MIRVVVFLLAVALIATGLSWLADRPGTLVINWEGHEVQTTVFHAIVLLAILLALSIIAWSILRGVWQLPAGVGQFFNRRREKRGLEALSSGLIAIGAGDKSLATRYAVQARKSLPNEPLTHILRAQAAQLSGDRSTARRIYEAMLSAPDTEALGLRGLFLEAEKEGETEAARQFAERAMSLNPRLPWPVHALFDLQCKLKDWESALETLALAKKHGHIEKPAAERKRAVLLTAQAQACEDSDPEKALKLAEEAHGLAPDLVPPAAIAGRMLAARGNVQKAAKILQKSWRKGPHPDIATAYAYARVGDSPRDRLQRVKDLAALSPHSIESPIAIATAAIDAKEFDIARSVLQPLFESRLTQRVCTLMARIEGEDTANTGAVREWLARAVNAPRDPAWTADGVVADDWAPVSPVTGALDAFQWRVPVEAAQPRDAALLHQKLEEFVKLGVRPEAVTAASVGTAATSASAASGDDQTAAQVGSIGGQAPDPSVRSTPKPAEPTSEAKPALLDDVEDVEVVTERPAHGATSAAPASTQEPQAEPAAPVHSAPRSPPAARSGSAPTPNPKPAPQISVEPATPQPTASQSPAGVGGAPRTQVANDADASVSPVAPTERGAADTAAPGNEGPAAASRSARSPESPRRTEAASSPVARIQQPAQMSRTAQPERDGRAREPNVFVNPRAPDDPGPDASDVMTRTIAGR